ncbi:MAG: hypothetical protein HYV09_04425 [Deltaproteobacteria bacterium]|nr:hypothetical protein [Deltaproteobacteria bacterium]
MTAMNILALACFNTGDRFLQRAKERGARVWLLTKESFLRKKPWRRDLLEDVLAEPDDVTMAQTINGISWLARTIKFDRIIPFDDVEVEAAAHLREHLRVPGMGDTRARVFRDKLAMRVHAEESGIPVPPFVGLIHHDDIRRFVERVPPPWMLKPRMEASSTGIRKIESTEELWDAIEAFGDQAAHHLLEKYLPGEVGHVDSIVSEGKVVFAEVHRNGISPFDVSHGGGVFSTYTGARGAQRQGARGVRLPARGRAPRVHQARGRRADVLPRGRRARGRRAHRRPRRGRDRHQPVGRVGRHRDRQGRSPLRAAAAPRGLRRSGPVPRAHGAPGSLRVRRSRGLRTQRRSVPRRLDRALAEPCARARAPRRLLAPLRGRVPLGGAALQAAAAAVRSSTDRARRALTPARRVLRVRIRVRVRVRVRVRFRVRVRVRVYSTRVGSSSFPSGVSPAFFISSSLLPEGTSFGRSSTRSTTMLVMSLVTPGEISTRR